MVHKTLERVAIVGLGPTSREFTKTLEAHGNRELFDEVWCLNQQGAILHCDRIFHMDDVRIQEIRAGGGNEKIKNMLAWMRTHPGPIYTSRGHPDYPGLVEYPFADVVKALGSDYFNNTGPYAIAFAIYSGVKELHLFGMDYTWPNAHEAEQGRACCEYWIRAAQERGVIVSVAEGSTLMDGFRCKPYGYDTVDVKCQMIDGECDVKLTPHDVLPTAEAIERRYDHSARPFEVKSDIWAHEALNRFLEYQDVHTVLDIGSGTGEHAKRMREAGKEVTTVSLLPPADFVGDYLDFDPEERFDAIWASHVLEHQPDVSTFLTKCFHDLRDDGVLAVTVPPLKHQVVGGHLNLFNAGTLLYNLIASGFDCREARVSQYGYNISVIVRKRNAELPELTFDAGDIERLKSFFPIPVTEGFNGEALSINW